MKNESYITDSIKTSNRQPKSEKKQISRTPKKIIVNHTSAFLQEIQPLTLTLPLIDPFSPVERLKKIPRTGKAIRLEKMSFESLQPRSIYDHVISMSYLADSFLELDKNEFLPESDYPHLGRLIAYHEINESLIGDIPAYTNIDGPSPKKENDQRIKNINQDKRERIVNNFLWMYANDQQRSSIEEMNKNLSQQNTPLMKYFKMLDRIDPVIAIWRYLYKYREVLQSNPREFVDGMNDFLVYPKASAYKNQKYSSDFPYLKDFLEVLLNPEAAIKYCKGTSIESLFKKRAKVIKYLIEEIPLFIEDN